HRQETTKGGSKAPGLALQSRLRNEEPKICGAQRRNCCDPIEDAERVVADAETGNVLEEGVGQPWRPVLFLPFGFALSHASEKAHLFRCTAIASNGVGSGDLLVRAWRVVRIQLDPMLVPPLGLAAPGTESGEGKSVDLEMALGRPRLGNVH